MKLKATKYLLPTTDGRLHKELSYLISLHENKMNKGKLESRISDLEHQFKQLEHNYREACLELEDRDNESDEDFQTQAHKFLKENWIQEKIGKPLTYRHFWQPKVEEPQPIESTQELFNQPLTIEQLKEGDVLVYEGSQYAFFTKGKEYDVFGGRGRLFIMSDDNLRWGLDIIDLSQFTLKAKPITTPEPITSKTLKTPNEWLKLMSEEERKHWNENTENADKNHYSIDMNEKYNFSEFIERPFNWLTSHQGYDYWQNISNRYNN